MVLLQAGITELNEIAKANDYTVVGVMAVVIFAMGWVIIKMWNEKKELEKEKENFKAKLGAERKALYEKHAEEIKKLEKENSELKINLAKSLQINDHQEISLKRLINIQILQNPESKEMLKSWLDG